jgi:putative transposase
MQLVQSRSAQQYNRRKQRKGAYWEDRYSCTMIDSGRYLWNCLHYVDLNMVRAGVVKHPEEWAWCGYREFMGLRERYRILDVGTLLTMLGYADLKKARVYYRSELEKQLTRGGLERDPIWTESLAVGDRSFIDAVKKSVSRLRIYMTERTTPEATKVWSIREARSAYS